MDESDFRQPDESDNSLSDEENRIYEEAIAKLRSELDQGRIFDQACECLEGIEQELRALIIDDFLKIIIAEDHFGSGKDIDDIALSLGIPYETVETARAEMLQEVGAEMAAQYRKNIEQTTH
ncbi:MAG: hypothetical protein OEV73_07875 [Desulfobulbaceae bacterium]|nr:hypothetical protein [Desulfobulbaceae bacterium]